MGAILLLLNIIGYAQTVSGNVFNESQEPLIGANVIIKGTNVGTITDIDGTFELDVPDLQTTILEVSYIGYTTKEIPINADRLKK